MRVIRSLVIAALLTGCRSIDHTGTKTLAEDVAADDQALREATYAADYEQKLVPFLDVLRNKGSFTGVGGVSIAYETYVVASPKASVLIVNGFADTLLTYREIIYDLTRRGYSVFVMDNRGQGLSQRLTGDPHLVHVESFDDYVVDLKAFVELKIKPEGRPLVLIGHSMGGLIAAKYALTHRSDVTKLVLMEPMLKINFGGIPESLVYGAALLGDSDGAVDGGGNAGSIKFEAQQFTHSRARFTQQIGILQANPQALTLKASNGWTLRAIEASKAARVRGAEIAMPLLMIQAGMDVMVDNGAQKIFCAATPSCALFASPTAYHETLNETARVRDSVVQQIFTFLAK